MWKIDSKLDDDQHDKDSLAIPQLHMKYMEFYNRFSLMKKEREIEMKHLIKQKWLYYKGKAPSKVYKELPFDLKLTTKEEISMFIEADEDVQKLQYKIKELTQVSKYLQQAEFQRSILGQVLKLLKNHSKQEKEILHNG